MLLHQKQKLCKTVYLRYRLHNVQIYFIETYLPTHLNHEDANVMQMWHLYIVIATDSKSSAISVFALAQI